MMEEIIEDEEEIFGSDGGMENGGYLSDREEKYACHADSDEYEDYYPDEGKIPDVTIVPVEVKAVVQDKKVRTTSKRTRAPRKRETKEQREIRLAKRREDRRRRLQEETPEQREVRLKTAREQRKKTVKTETSAQRTRRLQTMRERRKQKSQAESNVQKNTRLNDGRERTRGVLKTETREQREKRLKYLRDRQRQRIKNETPEQREKRLLYLRERQKERIRSETARERQIRLNRYRKYSRARKPPSEPELDVDIHDDVLLIRDSQCQVILTEPNVGSLKDPLALDDCPDQQGQEDGGSSGFLAIDQVWTIKTEPETSHEVWFDERTYED